MAVVVEEVLAGDTLEMAESFVFLEAKRRS